MNSALTSFSFLSASPVLYISAIAIAMSITVAVAVAVAMAVVAIARLSQDAANKGERKNSLKKVI